MSWEFLNTSDWLYHPSFQRYWRSYNSAMNWYHKHKLAYWKAEAAAQSYENQELYRKLNQLYTDTDLQAQHCHDCEGCEELEKTDGSIIKKDMGQEVPENDELELEVPENDELEFEISDEMLEFFKISHKHREEMKKKRLMAEQNDSGAEYINLADYREGKTRVRSEHAPNQQVGSEKLSKMKRLYGKSSPMICGMETAIDLNFDRHCLKNEPKLWPNIPIRILNSQFNE